MIRSPLQKVRGLELIARLRLPTTECIILPPKAHDYCEHYIKNHFIPKYGRIGIRTDTSEIRAGGTPFLFMESSSDRALAWCRAQQGYWLILCEPIPPKKVLVQAHVALRDEYGRLKLWGEANDTCTRSCREAVACGTPESGLRDIRHPDMWRYNEHWANIRRLLKERGLVERLAEVTVCMDGRLVFWEI